MASYTLSAVKLIQKRVNLPGVGLLVGVFVVWETAVRLTDTPAYLFPAPTAVFRYLLTHLADLLLAVAVKIFIQMVQARVDAAFQHLALAAVDAIIHVPDGGSQRFGAVEQVK